MRSTSHLWRHNVFFGKESMSVSWHDLMVSGLILWTLMVSDCLMCLYRVRANSAVLSSKPQPWRLNWMSKGWLCWNIKGKELDLRPTADHQIQLRCTQYGNAPIWVSVPCPILMALKEQDKWGTTIAHHHQTSIFKSPLVLSCLVSHDSC